MKRTPLRPGKSLKRKKPLRAKGRPRFKRGRDPAYLAWIRTLPCALIGHVVQNDRLHICLGAVEAAHVKSRGAGGTDRNNTLPVCSWWHATQHVIGIKSWAALYGLTVDDIKQLARDYTTRYLREHPDA